MEKYTINSINKTLLFIVIAASLKLSWTVGVFNPKFFANCNVCVKAHGPVNLWCSTEASSSLTFKY